MGLTGIWAVMLNKRAKKDSRHVLDSLEIGTGEVIADIGSGGGLFVFEFAERIGSGGKVFAVDTNKALLSRLEKMLQKQQIENVETLLGNEDGCPLPKSSCDLIFMRNVFHHIANPVLYLRNVKESLKSGGRLAIIEWSPDMRRNYISRAGHCTPEGEIRRVMQEAGLGHLKTLDFLEGQSFNIFSN